MKTETKTAQKRERFEQRIIRIITEAGYSPADILALSASDLVEIPGITIPNIRAILYVQKKLMGGRTVIHST
nr:hypothetical protein [Clostridiales bacterium]